MNHDEYRRRLESATDDEASDVLAHVHSCSMCRVEQRRADRALEDLVPRSGSRWEAVASFAAVAAALVVAVVGLSSWNTRPLPPTAGAVRYRIVGGPSGVVAYTPTETIVVSGTGSVASNDGKEIDR